MDVRTTGNPTPTSVTSFYLHTLKLDNSGIRKISVQALSSLNSIRVLDLSGNQLKTITFGFGPHYITTLNLAHNSLKFMPDLSSLSSLRYVDLSNNEIETVKPSYLPPNIESLRLSANKIAHLTPWPFLRKLQELDVSFNPLECVCPLWEFIGWAESLALFQEDSLPCQRPKSLRRSLLAAEEMICGPEVAGAPFVEQMTLSIGDPLRICCLISAHPKPAMWWEHEQQNISRDASLRRIPESGQIEFCLEVQSVGIEDLGGYRCFAQLEDVVSSKEFHVNKVQEPLVLKSPPNIIFYCQFSIGLFVFAFCCATCCILRRGQPMKTGPKKDNSHCHTVVHIMEDKNQSVETTTTPTYCDHEHYYSSEDYCTNDFQNANDHDDEDDDCLAPMYPYGETRRCLQPSPSPDDVTQRRISLWRHRIAAMPAPLAQFDKETNIMGIVHTSV
nr:Leucine-rich repeat domain containing protein [Haemonchus contortus]